MNRLRRILSAPKRFVRWLRDQLAKFLGPPADMIDRMIVRTVETVKALFARLLEIWRRIFAPAKGDPRARLPGGEASAGITAALVLAAVVYGPAANVIEALDRWVFTLVCIGTWSVTAFAAYRIVGLPHQPWPARLLRRIEMRAGLVRWEKAAFVASVLLTGVALVRDPHLLPLALGALIGFGWLFDVDETERQVGMDRPPFIVTPVAPDDEVPDGYVERIFTWELDEGGRDETQHLRVLINRDRFELARKHNVKYVSGPGGHADLVVMGEEWVIGGTSAEVEFAANELGRKSVDGGYSRFLEIANVLAFVQYIMYRYDRDSMGEEEYWKYPIETMMDENGDCEDTSILAAAVLRRMGHRVALFNYPSHIALGVEAPPGTPGHFIDVEGHRMYFCETTATGWKVGELPADLREAKPRAALVPR